MLDKLLLRRGLHCELACDGQEALDIVLQSEEQQKRNVDLVFMDSVMPVLSGPQAAKILRERGFTAYIVGITGNAMDEDVRDYEEHGADVVLTKPLRMEMLDKTLSFITKHSVADRGQLKDFLTSSEVQAAVK